MTSMRELSDTTGRSGDENPEAERGRLRAEVAEWRRL